MMLLALLIILVAAGLAIGVGYDGGDPVSVEILGVTRDTTVAGVFFAGVGTMLLLVLGARLLGASTKRSRRRRGERREMNERHRDSVARLEEERTSLRAENVRLSEQLSHDGAGGRGGRADDRERTGSHDHPLEGPRTERLVARPADRDRTRLGHQGYGTDSDTRHRDPI